MPRFLRGILDLPLALRDLGGMILSREESASRSLSANGVRVRHAARSSRGTGCGASEASKRRSIFRTPIDPWPTHPRRDSSPSTSPPVRTMLRSARRLRRQRWCTSPTRSWPSPHSGAVNSPRGTAERGVSVHRSGLPWCLATIGPSSNAFGPRANDTFSTCNSGEASMAGSLGSIPRRRPRHRIVQAPRAAFLPRPPRAAMPPRLGS